VAAVMAVMAVMAVTAMAVSWERRSLSGVIVALWRK